MMHCELMWWVLLKQNVACSVIDRMRLWRVPSAIVVAVVTLRNQLPSLATWPSRGKTLRCFETSGTTHPTTQNQMARDGNSQLLRCETLKTLITDIVSVQCLSHSRTGEVCGSLLPNDWPVSLHPEPTCVRSKCLIGRDRCGEVPSSS
jgi:hypothetical protein